jgi:hypothetical protein
LELRIVVYEINRQVEELQSAICAKTKFVKKQKELLLKTDVEIK